MKRKGLAAAEEWQNGELKSHPVTTDFIVKCRFPLKNAENQDHITMGCCKWPKIWTGCQAPQMQSCDGGAGSETLKLGCKYLWGAVINQGLPVFT